MMRDDPLSATFPGDRVQGDDGITGGNTKNSEKPNDKFMDPALVVNAYKSFLREHLRNRIRLITTMDNIESNEQIQRLYNIFGLINDFELLENQYLKLRKDVDFLPYTESLLERVVESTKNTNEPDARIALRVLHTAILSKLVHIRTNGNRETVVDLPGYLELIRDNIIKLKQAEKAVNLDEYQNKYKKALDEKIEKASELLTKGVTPELKQITLELDDRFSKLLNELVDFMVEETLELEQLKNLERELIEDMRLKRWIKFFKIVGNTLQLVSSVWDMVLSFIPVLCSFPGSFVQKSYAENSNRQGENHLYEAVVAMNLSVQTVKDSFASDHRLFLVQLRDIEDELREQKPESWVTDLKNKVLDIKSEVENQMRSGSILNPGSIRLFREELRDFITKIAPPGTYSNPFTILRDLNNYIIIDAEHNLSVRQDKREIAAVARAIKKSGKKLKKFRDKVDEINLKLIPMVQEMNIQVQKAMVDLQNQSPVQLDITKWRMQSSFRDIKALLHQMAEGFSVQAIITRSIDKLDEFMGLQIGIYNQIESFKEQQNFAIHMKNIVSGEQPKIADEDLRAAVLNLRKFIETNRVLEQWQLGTRAFKQHQFPFAAHHLSASELPSTLEFGNTESIIETAVDQINYLRNQVLLEQFTVGKYDREIFSNVEFYTTESSVAIPFYQWEYEDFSDEIDKLLSGEEILLKADIRNGLDLNAVKFNTIEIAITSSNKQTQPELDSLLRNSDISMSMVGNSYYRCGGNIYAISVDDNNSFEYSIDKLPGTRTPRKYNEVYRKIMKTGYFLSPYTMWKVQLKNNGLSYLDMGSLDRSGKHRPQTGSLRLELVGRGQYLKNEMYAPEVCTQELNKFYQEDTTTSTSDAMAAIQYQYSLYNPTVNESAPEIKNYPLQSKQ